MDSEEEVIESNIPAKLSDLDLLRNQVTEALNNFAENVQSRLNEIEGLIEQNEKTVATLVMGYAEQAVILEAVVAHVGTSSTDERKAFLETVEAGRKEMLDIMNGYSDAVEGSDPRTAATVRSMVEEQQPPASD